MSTVTHEPRMVIAAREDAIRVVPLHLPEETVTPLAEAPAAAAPQLTYRGGPLITTVQVFTVFWGSAWQTAAQSALVTEINHFFDFILTSSLLDQMAEYSVPAYPIGHGKHIGTATITTPRLRRSVSDTAIRHMLQQEISTNAAFPQPTLNTIYFVYLPPGVTISQGGGRSCMTFCGYHDNIHDQIIYAAMPYPGCTGCAHGLSVPDALTAASSHELCEAVTDPIPGQGWYDDANGEIGDICAWQTKTLGGFTVQLEWSNKANACV